MMNRHEHAVKTFSAVARAAAVGLVGTLSLFAEEGSTREPEVTVELGKVEQVTMRARVTAYGAVETEPATAAAPAAEATLTAPCEGLVTEASAVEGARVAKGDRLFRFDARLADAALGKARTRLAFARKTLERQKKLAEVDGTSAKNIQEAESEVSAVELEAGDLETRLALLEVVAPIGGTVTKVLAHPGATVAAGQALAVIKDLDRLVLRVAVAAREAAAVKAGQKAEVTAASGGAPVAASVVFVSPESDPLTDTVAVRLSLPPGCGLRLGQVATARIVCEVREGCLAVPLASLFTDRDGTSAVSLAKAGRSKKLPVTPGLSDGGLVEVRGEGLEKSQAVITTGSYALPDGTRIRVRDGTMQEGGR